MQEGAMFGLPIKQRPLVVEPKSRPRYTMAELLAASDYSQSQLAAEREWIDVPGVGGELL
jgi:antitoxin ChpS